MRLLLLLLLQAIPAWSATSASAGTWAQLQTICQDGDDTDIEVTLTSAALSMGTQITIKPGRRVKILGKGAVITGHGDSKSRRHFSAHGAGTSLILHDLTLKSGHKNAGAGSGGSIYLTTGAHLELHSCTVQDSKADEGGAIAAEASSVVLNNTVISNNIARNDAGGIAANIGSTLTIYSSTITSNLARASNGGGGGIHAKTSSTVVLNAGVVIENNQATQNTGGGIRLESSATLKANGATVKSNTGAAGGGGVYADASAVSMTNTTISSNAASAGQGGGIALNLASSLYIKDVVIELNTANSGVANKNGAGGGIRAKAGSTIVMDSAIVRANQADYGIGVAQACAQAEAKAPGSAACSNDDGAHGGGIRLEGGSKLLMNNVHITQNKAGNGRGGISMQASTLEMTSSRIEKNTVTQLNDYGGGGIRAKASSSLSLDTVVISENEAKNHGGGILVSGGSKLVLNNTFIRLNKALSGKGGGIRAEGAEVFANRGTMIGFNVAGQNDGGGISLKADANGVQATLFASGVQIHGNVAFLSGGGIHAYASTVILNDTNVFLNDAKAGGGGIYASASTLSHHQSAFSSNTPDDGSSAADTPLGCYLAETSTTACSKCTLKVTASGTNCHSGDYQDCVWPLDSTGGCKKCPAGKMSSYTFFDSYGLDKCDDCVAGKYQDREGQPTCKACSKGRYSAATGAASEATCINCASGQYNAEKGVGECTACPAGYYQSGTGKRACKGCEAGKYSGISAFAACIDCTKGQYSGVGQSACGTCSPGEYKSITNYGVCDSCYFQDGTAQANCSLCPSGYLQPVAGKSFCTARVTKPGTQLVEVTKADGTTELQEHECDAGEYSSGGVGLGCIACPIGQVQPKTAAGFCESCSVHQYIKLVAVGSEMVPDNKTCVDKPMNGVTSDGSKKYYEGQVWHDPQILNPDDKTELYTCVNDGCPDKDATAMTCKPGYKGPLCAACADGYFEQANKCVECGAPKPEFAAATVCLLLALIGCIAYFVHKYQRYLKKVVIFPYLKVVVSFFTVARSLDTQFGVVWPSSFAHELDVFSLMSPDLGIFSGLFCLVNISYYQKLLTTTLLLVFVFFAMLAGSWLYVKRSKRRRLEDSSSFWRRIFFLPIYWLIFAYPIVAVKVVRLFGCHTITEVINSTSVPEELATRTYLRTDYSLECYTSEWNAWAAYASVWIVFYVIGFPLTIAYFLWKDQQAKATSNGKIFAFGVDSSLFAFLADDYHPSFYFWEVLEMLRKLLLSVIGAFWSTKSTMCVATAFLVSTVFLAIHLGWHAFKSPYLRRLQTISLTVLSLCYFVGILLKTRSIESNDSDALDVMMVLLLVSIFALTLGAFALQYRAFRRWKRDILTVKESEDEWGIGAKLKDVSIDPSALELGKELGQGAEGRVCKATYVGSEVAVKVAEVSMCSLLSIKELLEEAFVEAGNMKELRHPNVVVFYGIAINYKDVEIECMTILELCAGSLDDRIFKSKEEMGWRAKIGVLHKISAGLEYLHSKGVYHRDLKPANVLIGKDGTPKLADFGLSTVIKEFKEAADRLTANIGTPVYMAPELMVEKGGRTDYHPALVDVYSFGILVWAVGARQKPY
eukprot:g1397.t1